MRPLAFLALLGALAAPLSAAPDAATSPRPNIILIIAEDMSADLGCHGVPDARTPHLDRLAAEGVRFTRAFTHAPVCAPSRSGMVTGLNPLRYGAQHMRSQVGNHPAPFTRALAAAGYEVLWPGKTDLQGLPDKALGARRQPWLDQAPPKAPFFAYHNIGVTHEAQIRADDGRHARNTRELAPADRRDPAKVALPPFYPDDPEIRREVAHYHELVTAADLEVGKVLEWVRKHGIERNTLVIFTTDHGRGMPRFKRSPKDSGTRVPLIARWPARLPSGSVRDDLVQWLDFAPTFLALAGAPVPPGLDGAPFLEAPVPGRRYVHSFRDYMDEDRDQVRSVRDSRFRYVRNLVPGQSESGHVAYQEVGATMRALRRGMSEGKLDATQAAYLLPNRTSEQLFDTQSDPWETRDLAKDPAHAEKLAELRAECDRWLASLGPLANLGPDELAAQGVIRPRSADYARRAATGRLETGDKAK